MDSAYEISEFIVNTKYEDLPSEVVDVAKKQVLDILANALGGSRDRGIKAMYELVREWGGKRESSIIGYGTKVPSPNAALVNSSMAFVLDYDDTHERGKLHAGVVVVPTALAVSEMVGGVNGKDMISALCVGVELGARLGMASKRTKPAYIMGGWDYAALHGFFTSSAVAGKLLGLDSQKMHNALGIAYHQAAGNGLSALDNADTKKMGPGFASRGGITSALMAQRGLTGAENVFDNSTQSFCNLYHDGCDKEILTNDLGKKFEMFDIGFKSYPCCRMGHIYIDAVLKLLKDKNIQADEVREIDPYVCHLVHVQLCIPQEKKVNPRNMISAQFSLHWALACAVVRRKVTIREFIESSLNDPAILDMATKVNPILDPGLPDELTFTKVKIKTNRGEFEINTDYARGSIQNPMSFKDIENKFLDCASIAQTPISNDRLDKAALMIRNLEKVKSVEEILVLLFS